MTCRCWARPGCSPWPRRPRWRRPPPGCRPGRPPSGTRVELEHLAATPVGRRWWRRPGWPTVDGRRLLVRGQRQRRRRDGRRGAGWSGCWSTGSASSSGPRGRHDRRLRRGRRPGARAARAAAATSTSRWSSATTRRCWWTPSPPPGRPPSWPPPSGRSPRPVDAGQHPPPLRPLLRQRRRWPPTRPARCTRTRWPPRRCASARTGCAGRRTRRCATEHPALAAELAGTTAAGPDAHRAHRDGAGPRRPAGGAAPPRARAHRRATWWCTCRTPTCWSPGIWWSRAARRPSRSRTRCSGRTRWPSCCGLTTPRDGGGAGPRRRRSTSAFVRAQHAELAELAWLIRAGHTGGAPPERVAAERPVRRPTRPGRRPPRLRRTRRHRLTPTR